MSETSKRIKRFKKELIKDIPLFPNNKATKNHLEAKPLPSVLIAYLNWKSRQIRPSKRKSILSPKVTADAHWRTYNQQIKDLIKQSENGDDLNPHLSLKALDDGYTIINNGDDKWQDKDQILNTKGLYHFHLSNTKMPKGHMDRTNELLFAYIDGETFHTLGIFSHDVFQTTSQNGVLNPERKRLLEYHDAILKKNILPGSVFIERPIMTSGHTLDVVSLVQAYCRDIEYMDPKLDDYEFLKQLFGADMPKKLKLDWRINYTDFGLFDSVSQTFLKLRAGLN